MAVALLLWLLSISGIEPSPDDLQWHARRFSDRRHHIGVDVTFDFRVDRELLRYDGTSFGLNYEYLVDRRFHGVSLELVTQMYGNPFTGGPKDFFTGAGLAYYPMRNFKIFAQAGSFFDGDHVHLRGRAGIGHRTAFYAVGVMPITYVDYTSDGSVAWSFGGRVQY